ncbi:MAG: cardiolipin synthase [Clostridiales Family XIII bacterium]|jgi:cardiolipin synthase|nr:cardiolipin synthase [Clostridiales Family XIII bacterium]
MTVLGNFIAFVLIIDVLIVVTIIFFGRKSPSATFAWILVVLFLPIIGIIFYAFLSQNIARKKIFKYTREERKKIDNILIKQKKIIEGGEAQNLLDIEKKWHTLVSLNRTYGKSILTDNNKIEIFFDGQKLKEDYYHEIENAKRSIDIEYYTIKSDTEGEKFANLLLKKAKDGIKIRLVLDAAGSKLFIRKYEQIFKGNGIALFSFFPAIFNLINLKLNYRNHRKLLIIDDKIAYIGGFNIGNAYINKKKRYGFWRDTHLKIVGGVVNSIIYRFILDLRQASNMDLNLPSNLTDHNSLTGDLGIQIVSSGPDDTKEEIKHAFLRMITYAEKSIYIQTPYFIPDDSIFEALQIAAYSGIDVRIMIPAKKDHPFVQSASRYYAGVLLESGIKLYMYRGGFLHSKTIIVDNQVSSVGSANFDIRSFKLNFETSAFIYSEKISNLLSEQFIKDISQSKEITWREYKKRPRRTKIKENLSRLLSDIL